MNYKFVILALVIIANWSCKPRNGLSKTLSGLSNSSGELVKISKNTKGVFTNQSLKTVFAITSNSTLEAYVIKNPTDGKGLKRIYIDTDELNERKNLEFLNNKITDYASSQDGKYIAIAHNRGINLLEFNVSSYESLKKLEQKISVNGNFAQAKKITDTVFKPLIQQYQIKQEGEWGNRGYDEFLEERESFELSNLSEFERPYIIETLRKIMIEIYKPSIGGPKLAEIISKLRESKDSERIELFDQLFDELCGEQGYQCEKSLLKLYEGLQKEIYKAATTPINSIELLNGGSKVVKVIWSSVDTRNSLIFYTENHQKEHRLYFYDPSNKDTPLSNIKNHDGHGLLASFAREDNAPKIKEVFWRNIHEFFISTTDNDIIYASAPILQSSIKPPQRINITINSFPDSKIDYDHILQRGTNLFMIKGQCIWPLKTKDEHQNNDSGITFSTSTRLIKDESDYSCSLKKERHSEIKILNREMLIAIQENEPGEYRLSTGEPRKVFLHEFAEEQFPLMIDRSKYDLNNDSDRYRASFELTHAGLHNAYARLFIQSKYYEMVVGNLTNLIKNEKPKLSASQKDSHRNQAKEQFKKIEWNDFVVLYNYAWATNFQDEPLQHYTRFLPEISKLKTTYNRRVDIATNLLPEIGYEFANITLDESLNPIDLYIFNSENAVFRKKQGDLYWWSVK